jgi:3-isopropylmalate/(R)-2-methylmalate dehydratase small subunit
MGKTYKYGDNVDTDVIIPARYLNIADPGELATHAMEDIDADFAKTVQRGDIIVAGRNFGSGSSREHAPLVLKEAGVAAVIAPSFARIFYRNAFNIGLPILESTEAPEKISAGDELTVDFSGGKIFNHTRNEEYQAEPFPEFMTRLIEKGGLVNYCSDN